VATRASEPSNDNQIEFWNVQQGDKWVRLRERTDATLRPFGDAAMDRLGLGAGEHVLDVGCGCGDTTLQLAARVAPGGSVTGADVSRPMLAHARERAAEAAEPRPAFIEADVQRHRFPPKRLDAVFSRFGVMFFAAPEAAFANLRRATRPGGRLSFVCWREPADNPWVMTAVEVARAHVELPPPPAPDEPGQFSFADEGRVGRVLKAAGWRDATFDRFDVDLLVGRDVADATAFLVQMGPAGAALAEADDATRAAAAEDLAAALEPFAAADGVRLGSSAWIVTARRR